MDRTDGSTLGEAKRTILWIVESQHAEVLR